MCRPPTTKQLSLYRIEEKCRTIYVSSDIDPTQRDIHNLFTLGKVPEPDPIWRTKSHVHHSIPQRIYRTQPPDSSAQTTILFYHKDHPYYEFTNFSPHPVIYKGKKYPTSEHLFQSFKFEHRPHLAERIRTCSYRPSGALAEARKLQHEVRTDWRTVNIKKMDETLYHKFTQHPVLQAQLLATGDANLVENSDKDDFWGIGPNRNGRNELGKCLERLRAKLLASRNRY